MADPDADFMAAIIGSSQLNGWTNPEETKTPKSSKSSYDGLFDIDKGNWLLESEMKSKTYVGD